MSASIQSGKCGDQDENSHYTLQSMHAARRSNCEITIFQSIGDFGEIKSAPVSTVDIRPMRFHGMNWIRSFSKFLSHWPAWQNFAFLPKINPLLCDTHTHTHSCFEAEYERRAYLYTFCRNRLTLSFGTLIRRHHTTDIARALYIYCYIKPPHNIRIPNSQCLYTEYPIAYALIYNTRHDSIREYILCEPL